MQPLGFTVHPSNNIPFVVETPMIIDEIIVNVINFNVDKKLDGELHELKSFLDIATMRAVDEFLMDIEKHVATGASPVKTSEFVMIYEVPFVAFASRAFKPDFTCGNNGYPLVGTYHADSLTRGMWAVFLFPLIEIDDAHIGGGGTRTHKLGILSPLPLPFGYAAQIASTIEHAPSSGRIPDQPPLLSCLPVEHSVPCSPQERVHERNDRIGKSPISQQHGRIASAGEERTRDNDARRIEWKVIHPSRHHIPLDR